VSNDETKVPLQNMRIAWIIASVVLAFLMPAIAIACYFECTRYYPGASPDGLENEYLFFIACIPFGAMFLYALPCKIKYRMLAAALYLPVGGTALAMFQLIYDITRKGRFWPW
jgi:hypothetical protein